MAPGAGEARRQDRPKGRYAWWVGDEGVKAKINLVAPYKANDLATADQAKRAAGLEHPPHFAQCTGGIADGAKRQRSDHRVE